MSKEELKKRIESEIKKSDISSIVIEVLAQYGNIYGVPLNYRNVKRLYSILLEDLPNNAHDIIRFGELSEN